mmetsp:Transcript_67379/g.166432  ORF Transcript_67379/g.166432 Transcript_67379/m.166432 type:complete len:449 (-) Transcript_67379:1400-2746(-)
MRFLSAENSPEPCGLSRAECECSSSRSPAAARATSCDDVSAASDWITPSPLASIALRFDSECVHAFHSAPIVYSSSCGWISRDRKRSRRCTPPHRLSSSWFSSLFTHKLRMAAMAHSSISVVLAVSLMTPTSTLMALACRAAVWFWIELAHALASAAPACSRARGPPVWITSMSAAIPFTRFSSALFGALLMHALRSAPAACSFAASLPVRSSATSPGIAALASSFSEGSLAHDFQIAPAASSCPTAVPATSCWIRSGMPLFLMSSMRDISLSTMAFHSAVVAFSCACGSPLLSRLSTSSMPPAAWKKLRVSLLSSMALAMAAVAASLTRGVPVRIRSMSASTPPYFARSRMPTISDGSAGPSAREPSRGLRAFTMLASALAAFSCTLEWCDWSMRTRGRTPAALMTAMRLSALLPHAAAMACAALACSSGLSTRFRRSTMAGMPPAV